MEAQLNCPKCHKTIHDKDIVCPFCQYELDKTIVDSHHRHLNHTPIKYHESSEETDHEETDRKSVV